MKRRVLTCLLTLALLLTTAAPAAALGGTPGADISDRQSYGTGASDGGSSSAGESALAEVIVELEGEPLLAGGEAEPGRREALLTGQEAVLAEISTLPGLAGVEAEHHYVMTINAMSMTLPRDRLDEVSAVNGVRSVHETARFLPPEHSDQTETAVETGSAGGMIGLEQARELGYDGAGTVIAVVDTGLDIDHPAFEGQLDAGELGLAREDVEQVLDGLNAAQNCEGLTIDDVYHSDKIPFAFNYADASADVTHEGDSAGDHGTHVAGIAAGSTEEAEGIAPQAQLVIMKVFGANEEGASEAVLLAALEDAVALGVDVINMSLGTTAGFSRGGLSYVKALEAAEKAGIVVCAAGGNDYSSAYGNISGTGLGTTGNIDVGTVSEPGSLAGVLSVASVNNAWAYSEGFYIREDGTERFIPISDHGAQFGMDLFASLLGEDEGAADTYQYVVIPGAGDTEDFSDVDAEGKVALIRRGEIPFAEKCDNAYAAGAVAAVIYNMESESILMDLTGVSLDNHIPCVMISKEDGEAMAAAAGTQGAGELTISREQVLAETADGWLLSDFSSWGAAPDLTLKPELAAVGANIRSATDGGTYGVKSGTSMAAPQTAGMTALVLQYLRDELGIEGAEAARLAQTLLMNTAIPMTQTDGVEYSPRKQGAGLANVGRAVTTGAYVTVSGNALPKAELGDDRSRSGRYQFTFTVHNMTDRPLEYLASASVLTETAEDGRMMQQARAADVQVTFSSPGAGLRDETGGAAVLVAVPPNGETAVTVTVSLTKAEKERLDAEFENGIYVEGYVTLRALDEGGADLSIPMLAFYGDWSRAPLFERTYIAELDAESGGGQGNSPTPFEIVTGDASYLGMNPVCGEETYLPRRSNALNTSGGEGGVIDELVLDLLRGARRITVDILDSSGSILYQSSAEYVAKSSYQDSYQQMVPVFWSQYDEEFFFDPGDCGLGDGSTFTIRITGVKDTSGPYATETISIPAYVDGTAPEVLSVRSDREDGEDGARRLTVTVRDNFYTAGIFVFAADGETVMAAYPADQRVRGAAMSIEIDVTELVPQVGGTFYLGVMDYGQNMTMHEVNVLEEGESTLLPDDTFYGFYTGYDGDGWCALAPDAPETVSNGFMNYMGSICAAESVGDHIFAVEYGNSDLLYAIDAATFQPELVCSLGLADYGDSVLDLAYCRENDILYALVNVSGEFRLLGIDLFTEAVETAAVIDETLIPEIAAAYALACGPDGAIRLIVGTKTDGDGEEQSAIYTLTELDGAAKCVRSGELGLALKDSTISAAADQDTGTVYFTYYAEWQDDTSGEIRTRSEWYCWEEGAKGGALTNLGELPPVCFEALTRTGGAEREFPASGAVLSLTLSHESKHLGVGGRFSLSAERVGPWYVDGAGYQTRFSSSDPSVAVVDQSGTVTAAGLGEAVITVTMSRAGAEEVSAQCQVLVEESREYFALLDGESWVRLDAGTMQAEELPVQMSADVSAAAYAAGGGPEGQDVIYVLDRGTYDAREQCQAYALLCYDAVTWELLEEQPLMRTWMVKPEMMPEDGFADMAYDPYYGYLVAVSGGQFFAIDPQRHRFYMTGDAAGQLDSAELIGVAFDSDGNGWYADSRGNLGAITGYLGSADLRPMGTALRLDSDGQNRTGMEYDELRNMLWISAGGRLYGMGLTDSGFRQLWSKTAEGALSCLLIRHFPSGRNQVVKG